MKKYDGVALVLAWPQSYCKQAGAWYDLPMRWLGFNVDYYYQAGHAAVVLADKKTGECNYFDFGRYHSPLGYGRARSAETDPELTVKTKALIDPKTGFVRNARQIYDELQANKSCHGDGTLYSSQVQILLSGSLNRAKQVQSKSFVKYGPFVWGGSNCSRFVSGVIQAGNPPLKNLLPLKYFVPLTPTTLTNVNSGSYKCKINKQESNGKVVKVIRPNFREWAVDLTWLQQTCPAPHRHQNIPEKAQWLSGEGHGSWFDVVQNPESLLLTKYSPKGDIESVSTFPLNINNINFSKPFKVTYPSNAKVLTLIQNGYICTYNC